MRAERPVAHAPRASRVAGGGNRVRIIGGEWRSRIVRFRPREGLRPTPDRVRETLFNWLGQRLDGLACVDLFAGSGALGFEARSRGASPVVLIEKDREAVAQLSRAAEELGGEGLQIVQGDALAWLARSPARFDVAFVDPPYGSGELSAALSLLERTLNPDARVYVEAPALVDPPSTQWVRLREGSAGAVHYALFAVNPSPSKADAG